MYCAIRTKVIQVLYRFCVEKQKSFSLLIYNKYGLTNVFPRCILLNIFPKKLEYYSLGDVYTYE